MRDKIAELAIKEVRWGVDGIITPDPVEIGEAIANEIMRLIRQYPTTETVDRYDGMTSTTTDRVNRYALVPLPEEDV